ncbi:hypothetical protein [Pseudopedobacter beijingensis]|uniref:DUF4890 domain-containing protein n=1 Tax=Pseudopedobacter beijingensis TaxID=1207056 RepID=A0ABW4IFG9_9SPHI
MKRSILKITSVLLLVTAVGFQSKAQDRAERRKNAQSNTEMQGKAGGMQQRGGFNIPNATEEQKALLKNLNEKREQQQKDLEATYTDKQKEIAANASMNFREKRQALESSYTDSQKQLQAKYREELKTEREKLNKTLTDAQKESMRGGNMRGGNR